MRATHAPCLAHALNLACAVPMHARMRSSVLSRRFLRPACACLVLAIASGAAGSTSTASRMVDALTGADWGMAHAEWRAAHPAATCARAATTVAAPLRSEQWCFSCSEQAGDVLVESRFHLLDGAQDRVCRLYELQISARPQGRSKLRSALEPVLTERRPASTVSSQATWQERDAERWQGLRVWRNDVRVDYVYEGRPIAGAGEPRREPAVVLRSIEPSLLASTTADAASAVSPWDQAVWRSDLRVRLVAALEPEFHNAALLISDPAADVPEPRRDVVLGLLRAAESAAPERRPVLLLAADQLAEGLAKQAEGRASPAAADWDPDVPGLTYTLKRPSGNAHPTYHHDLLERVWAERRHSVWREFAFLELQHAGWDFSDSCARGEMPFAEVIDRGTAYLDEHPDSTWRAAQLLFLAQAHETRWTVSRVVDERVDVRGVGPHGEAAHQLAIAYYGRIAAEFPQSAEAAHARAQLARVDSDLPPSQWKYFCRKGR
jgi:hypothetical protein